MKDAAGTGQDVFSCILLHYIFLVGVTIEKTKDRKINFSNFTFLIVLILGQLISTRTLPLFIEKFFYNMECFHYTKAPFLDSHFALKLNSLDSRTK